MANVAKMTGNSEVYQLLRHCHREIENNSNKDIDPERTYLNYSLTPDHEGLTEYEYYKLRLDELYIYNRNVKKDTVTAAGWIVTLPEGDYSPEEERRFFESCSEFLCERYGGEDNRNTISVTVHYDEGKLCKERDGDGELIRDENGRAAGDPDFRIGRPHLHYVFVPTAEIDHAREEQKKWHDPEIDRHDEKLASSAVLCRKDLSSFHDDLQKHLNEEGLDQFRVKNGKTPKSGYTVEHLKERTEMQDRIADLESALSNSRDEVKRLAAENRELQQALERMMEINRDLQRALEEQKEKEQERTASRWRDREQESERSRKSRWED